MINLSNQEFNIKLFDKNDLLICAFGYESRSIEMYNKVKNIVNPENILAFVFEDYKNYDYISDEIDKIIEKEIKIVKVQYESAKNVSESIEEFLQLKQEVGEIGNVHIDYSSMPRRWYYELPVLLKEIVPKSKNIYFWYVAGIYPGDYEAYPSAGIDSFSVSGKPSLRIGAKRMHVIGLSYDAVRTSAMISILDPDSYITCNAYNRGNSEINDNVRLVNKQVISMSNMDISVQVDDFVFMFSKICEIANEFLPLGDVILVPDGPKPLIMAMSLVPFVLNRPGITCLHVSRNKDYYTAIDVKSTENIYGFSI